MRPRVRNVVALIACATACAAGGIALWARRAGDPPEDVSPGVRSLITHNLRTIPAALARYDARLLTTSDPPWLLFHGLVGHGGDYLITAPEGTSRECLDWLLHESSWRPLFKDTPLVVHAPWGVTFTHGPTPAIQMEFEDHFCQFLFVLLECRVDPDATTVRVPPDGDRRTIRQMVADEQRACHSLSDVSWAITVFAAWGQSAWTNRFGEQFNLERMLTQHLDREQYSRACFGTHWRMGLALAVRDLRGRVGKDVMRRAEARLAEAVDEARSALDAEGQFRLEWGVYPQTPPGFQPPHPMPQDADILLSHQAHMIEWLMVALPDNTLATEDWIHRAVARLCATLGSRTEPVNYGAHSHCAHALRLYRQRVGGLPGFPVAMNEPATAAPPY